MVIDLCLTSFCNLFELLLPRVGSQRHALHLPLRSHAVHTVKIVYIQAVH